MDKDQNNIVISDLRESLIMRDVRIHIPMPQGAAVPARATPPTQPAPQAPTHAHSTNK
jgi:hypothetical protein